MTLPLKVKYYIGLIIGLAVVIMTLVIMNNDGKGIDIFTLVFWIILAVMTESLVLRLPSGMGLSVSLAIVLAALIAQGPLVGTIVTGAGFLFRIIKIPGDKKYAHLFNTPLYKTLFNVSQSVLAIGMAGLIYSETGGIPGQFQIWHTLLVVVTYTILNSVIMSVFFALLKNQTFANIWISSMRGIWINVFLVGSMGIILFLAFESYGVGAVLLFLGPLLLARFSFAQYTNLRETYVETIKAFNRLTEAKDTYTGEHSTRVETYAVELARYIKLPDNKVETVRMAAILHDIGKVGISDKVLNKPSKLTDEEYDQIKKHSEIGADIIQNVHFLKDVSIIIRHHHERFDGKGYPDHQKGDEICTESIILSLADVYDAITSKRSYRDAFPFQTAVDEIDRCLGTQFDPKIGKAFVELMKKKEEVFNRDVV
ncbi:MAG: HD-GYP domain-containing protein [Saccharofermentanales bacterium]